MDKNTFVAIMAGGIGSRFWPKSRSAYPKQFLDILNNGKTLIQMTFERFTHICPAENIYIVTNEDYVDILKEQLPMLTDQQILKEPARRNTAPCIAYVSNKIFAVNQDAKIIVSPADHLITQELNFVEVMKEGLEFVGNQNALLTLGIKPSRPDTGYGYIQFEEDKSATSNTRKVKTFTEKPNLDLAKTFLKSGDFLWNSGMFIWHVKAILQAFHRYLPEVADTLSYDPSVYNTDKEQDFINTAYSQCTNISIDYGVMEKADNVFVLPADFGWSDVGTWGSLHQVLERDYLDNAVVGKKVKIYNSANNMVVVNNKKLAIIEGLNDCIVIDTDDVLLIWNKQKEQDIKKITNDLKLEKLSKYL